MSHHKEIVGNRLFWHRSRNFGDALAPLLYREIFGVEAEYCDKAQYIKGVILGSILNDTSGGIYNSWVWGAGFAHPPTEAIDTPITFYGIRGPRSRFVYENYRNIPEVYGDPAQFCAAIWPFPEITEKTTELLLLAHWVDMELATLHFGNIEGIKIISTTAGEPLDILREIKKAKRVATTSLHGFICAHSYGVPAAAFILSGSVIESSFKFLDYLEGQGVYGYNMPIFNADVRNRPGCVDENYYKVYPSEFIEHLEFVCPDNREMKAKFWLAKPNLK